MKQSLVAFDTDRIKEYVFATGKLTEIRGASHILDRLNRVEMRQLVGGTCYYALGGGGLFVVPTDHAPMAIERVGKAYAEQTGNAATITGVQLPLPEGFNVECDNIQPHWKHLGYKLRAAKARNPEVHTSVSHPLLHFGHTDGTFYATHPGEDQELISTPAFLKRAGNCKLRNQGELPKDFAAIASATGYMALIYADGDRLGEAFAACDNLPQIQATASLLDNILKKAKQRAVDQQRLASYHYDTLLQGGDDLILAVPASNAFDLALHLTKTFRDEASQRLQKSHTLSTAIVWAHKNFPFSAWLNIAESVLKFAKMEGAKRNCTGLINFLAISSTHHLDFDEVYKQTLITQESEEREIIRTLRPYTLDDMHQLKHYRQRLRRLPRSKLEALRQATYLPLARAMLEARRVFVHWRDEATRKDMVNMVHDLVYRHTGGHGNLMFPFMVTETDDASEESIRTYRTPIPDLAEIWDFLPGEKHEARTY